MTLTVGVATGAIAAAVGTVLLEAVSRRWRSTDPSLWHSLWLALAVSSLAAPIVPAAAPMWRAASWLVIPAPGIAGSSWVTSPVAGFVWTAAIWVYVAGVVWFLVRLAIGLLLVQRLARQAIAPEALASARLHHLVPMAAGAIRTHRRVRMPLAAGFVGPVIILPPDALFWPADRLGAVVSHEWAHVERHDYLWNVVAAVHQAVYWFSPFAWWLSDRLRLAAEIACDERASSTLGRTIYARQLAETGGHPMPGRTPGLLAPGATTNLVERLHALMGSAPRRPPIARHWRVALVVAVILVVALMASTRLGTRG